MKKKYWYLIEIRSCVLCGREQKTRTRQYSPKPKNPADRIIWEDKACDEHFM